MSELPKGWAETKLGEISQLEMGQSPPGTATNSDAKGIPLIGGASDFVGEQIKPNRFTSAPTKICQPNDLILCVRATIGKLAVAESAYCLGRGVAGIRPRNVNQDWLRYRLIGDASALDAAGTGSTFRQIDKQTLVSWNINLPPLNEQRRIVAKLDRLFARSRCAREELGRVSRLVQRYKQAVLAAAFRGDLTADWRAENPDVEPASELLRQILIRRKQRYNEKYNESKLKNKKKPRKDFVDQIPSIQSEVEISLPKTWAVTNIDYLAHVTKLAGFEYTKHFKTNDVAGIPIIRAQNVQMGKFIETNIKYISEDVSNYLERSQLHGREVLMVFIGAGTGNVCLAPQERRWHLAPNVAKIDVDEISSNYLCLYLQSSIGQNYVDSWIKSTAQPSLSMETIRKIIVFLSPLEEQKEIVRRVEKLFKAIDLIEQEHQKASKLLDRLEKATLSKAFRGELVPQDPNDEPAAVLLERIQAERQTQPKRKAKSTRKPKAN
ncbi:restriction modification system DNA specificity domain [Limnospira maxima CS-328]|uniref:Restriction modification system DNA specificity domain n=1 Tax=Limnospira maxima CS-328 TaxID=513049 RepID=B5W475_LIMMA|nr:restriction endonuclease subunit S [Limnospira maxima]EDZ93650.1 restriction modification system DNA specificity domain [Limnospira maxima CS-328]MDC0839273.1 restriction endonuclease subunit S [Limnoraphis robusta]